MSILRGRRWVAAIGAVPIALGFSFACGGGEDRPDPGQVTGHNEAGPGFEGGGGEGGEGGTEGGLFGPACTLTFDPGKVYLRGSTAPGEGIQEAWITDMTTKAACPALSYTVNDPVIGMDKKILYVTEPVSGMGKVFEFHPDQIYYDVDRWKMPKAPRDNDVMHPSTSCPNTQAVFAWPDKNDYAYACNSPAGEAYTSAGARLPLDAAAPNGEVGILALGYGGHVLRQGVKTVTTIQPYITDTQGVNTAEFVLPLNSLGPFKAKSNGFLVVFGVGVGAELNMLGFDGSVMKIGDYADVPPETDGGGRGALDADGVLFQFSHISAKNLADCVIRRPLKPGVATIVWDESQTKLTDNEFLKSAAPIIVPQIHNSVLVTGP